MCLARVKAVNRNGLITLGVGGGVGLNGTGSGVAAGVGLVTGLDSSFCPSCI